LLAQNTGKEKLA